jgi:hypothetical protein
MTDGLLAAGDVASVECRLEYQLVTVLTNDKITALKALLLSAPPATASKLWALLERMKVQGVKSIPTGELLEAMREAGIPSGVATGKPLDRVLSFDRLFFEPFENLFEHGSLHRLIPGSLPRIGLDPVWTLIIGQLAPDAYVDLEPLGTAASLRGDMAQAREYAQRMRTALLANINDIPPERLSALSKMPEASHILGRLIPMLSAEKAVREMWSGVQSLRGDMGEQSIHRLATAVKEAEDVNPQTATEILLMTMSVLPKPFQALRVLQRVSRGVDDRKIDTTHFAVIGRRVIELLRREGAVIEHAALGGVFDVDAVRSAIDRHNKIVHGMTRDTILSRKGPWKQELNSICSQVGSRLEMICHAAVKSLDLALPMDMVRKKNAGMLTEPRYRVAIDPTKMEIARCHMHFLVATRLLAPLAGFGGFRDNANRTSVGQLDAVCEGLLRVAGEGKTSPHFQDWIDATSTLISVLDGRLPAKNFERRITSLMRNAA